MDDNKEVCDLGVRIDQALDNLDARQLESLDFECAKLIESTNGIDQTILFYFRANIQSGIWHSLKIEERYQWGQSNLIKEMSYLQSSIKSKEFDKLHYIRRFQIQTNYANKLSSVGRNIEAIELLGKILRHKPYFGTALGNRGSLIIKLTEFIINDNTAAHICVLLGYDELLYVLKNADSKNIQWDSDYFMQPNGHLEFYKSRIDQVTYNDKYDKLREYYKSFDIDKNSMPKAERKHHKFILEKNLFLHPINVIGNNELGSFDSISLPALTTNIYEKPIFLDLFNQLKSEFCFARLMYFESNGGRGKHYADTNLNLSDSEDYSAFGMSVEKLRASFRSAYSMLDKIAIFINLYYDLSVAEKNINIRDIWYENNGKNEKIIRKIFSDSDNFGIRALFHLSFDIVGASKNNIGEISPMSKTLNEYRNCLEHRFLLLKDYDFYSAKLIPNAGYKFALVDELYNYTFDLLKLVRAALFYLTFAIEYEENKRKIKSKNPFPVDINTYKRDNHII